MNLKVRKLTASALVPYRAYDGDAGFDLFADEQAHIAPGERRLIRTGVAIELPEFSVADVRSRSGLANDRGVIVLNSPGTIDQGFRGEIMVNLFVTPQPYRAGGGPSFDVYPGLKIAQLVVFSLPSITIEVVESLGESERGERGHGSSG